MTGWQIGGAFLIGWPFLSLIVGIGVGRAIALAERDPVDFDRPVPYVPVEQLYDQEAWDELDDEMYVVACEWSQGGDR